MPAQAITSRCQGESACTDAGSFNHRCAAGCRAAERLRCVRWCGAVRWQRCSVQCLGRAWPGAGQGTRARDAATQRAASQGHERGGAHRLGACAGSMDPERMVLAVEEKIRLMSIFIIPRSPLTFCAAAAAVGLGSASWASPGGLLMALRCAARRGPRAWLALHYLRSAGLGPWPACWLAGWLPALPGGLTGILRLCVLARSRVDSTRGRLLPQMPR